ncbi:Long-chain-fatty-acid--CoA ligase (plasmid) [Tsukamurella tyrosinosolvens]|uniref:Long-chain acyl-CoA synthetase n=1 Tax=Tsukamurella tyrosinosolvens TaxID=57704 RepID=A0A1H4T7U9_TSUTY|nr:AMP-binding protein [Tsukamurella tyrosinosolvens]KXO93275.1 acyl-CoA synthetase [Tsukamurella tyrosinosolvens]SEC52201.1 long-chain acyl-CoA synthetase [Tsukamurella tyrosinosolvens]VEH88563.1 Long-chain-fatty-acid--CoA ligase [Tsukamurella tyrosinosolvens]
MTAVPGAAQRPWAGRYETLPAEVDIAFDSALAMFRAGVASHPDQAAIRYFDGAITRRELDELTDALAAGLLAEGFAPGDRLALYLQNVPQFVIGMIAAWKAGGCTVSINPMSRARELENLLLDSGATALIALDDLYEEIAREVVPATAVRTVFTTSGLDLQSRADPRLFPAPRRATPDGATDLLEFIAAHRGEVPPPVAPAPGDTAFLTYTSGTTGKPKGAINTHRNVVFTATVYRDAAKFAPGPDAAVLAIAPLFHITGLIGHIALSMLAPMPMILAYRFDPAVMLETMREHRPTCTIGAVTAFNALLNHADYDRDALASLTSVYSGGAPISPTAARRFAEATGRPLHNAYGLTETTSPMTVSPYGVEIPVDPDSGALSVGLPAPSTVVRIVGDDGADLPLGEIGEIVAEGPQVVAGYWNKPEETAAGIPGGALHSGDVGFMDDRGWVFIVDRKKDMINASGYKVWPREVEDVLAEHPAVREAAVVGVPDEVRGETVRAFVSLMPGADASPEDLIAHCRERMAAYKYPRDVRIVEELPKTVTGKILRRELRDA